MRMGQNKISAQEVINYLTANELDKIFKYFGEEKYSKIISKKIVNNRKNKEIRTEELVEIINMAKKNYTKKINLLKFFKHLEFSSTMRLVN